MIHSKNSKMMIFILLLGGILSACSVKTGPSGPTAPEVVKTDKGSYTNLSVSELQAMLKNKDFTFVNVHIPYQGHIAQTDVFIPYDTIAQNLTKLPADKNAKIVLYCRGGAMSAAAARVLADLGYSHVYQLVGGFSGWKAAGLALETNQQ